MEIKEEIKQSRFRNHYQEAAINILYTAGWLANQHKDFFAQFDITSQQFNILSILRGQHPNQISGSEIKSRMMDKNSDVSRLLDRLLSKGLIVKATCPEDKRAANISISAQGLELLKKSDAQISQLDNILGNLNEKEASQLSRLLDKDRGEARYFLSLLSQSP